MLSEYGVPLLYILIRTGVLPSSDPNPICSQNATVSGYMVLDMIWAPRSLMSSLSTCLADRPPNLLLFLEGHDLDALLAKFVRGRRARRTRPNNNTL
jgi:hypothetical protein